MELEEQYDWDQYSSDLSLSQKTLATLSHDTLRDQDDMLLYLFLALLVGHFKHIDFVFTLLKDKDHSSPKAEAQYL